MKKKNLIILSVILVIIVCLLFSFKLYKTNQENKTKIQNQERYNEIKESVKKAVHKNISAMYPGCLISKDFKKKEFLGTQYNSSFLINNGYIKKSELLDVDKESYCDVFVDINLDYKDPLDHQHNCEVYYKIYLKCKNYKDAGYINWE